jgi:cold shock CspA family protein
LRIDDARFMLEPKGEPLKGTIRSLDPIGHGIIQATDGSKVPFLFIDVLSRKVLVLGQRVVFSVRRVQGKVFAENISYEADPRAV